MIIASAFTWFTLIPGVEGDGMISSLFSGKVPPNAEGGAAIFCAAWFTCFLLLGIAFLANRQLKSMTEKSGIEGYYADDKMSFRNMAELFTQGILGLMSGSIRSGRDTALFISLLGSLFAYIWFSNLQSLVPGFAPPTDNVNTNVGAAVMVFVLFNFVGLTRGAKAYLAHLWGPVFFIGFLLFPIEIISLFIRPLSLTLRLTGNMFGDHTVFSVMSSMLPDMTGAMADVFQWIAFLMPIPVPFLALALLVSTIQALVFVLLSTSYIGGAIESADHGDHH